MRALLVANSSDSDPGLVGERLREHGYSFTECHRERPAQWPTLEGVELVVQLGSDWSVYWPEVADAVTAECELVRGAHGRGTPVLGICFGAQVITTALAGRVERAPHAEVGWHRVESSVAGIADGPWMQWHYDRCVELPVGAELLAVSPLAHQAFRLGRTFATQFHPEVDRSMIDRWLRLGGAAELERLGLDREALIADTDAAAAAALVNTPRLIDWFLAEVAGSTGR